MLKKILSICLFLTALLTSISLPIYLKVASEFSRLESDDPGVWESAIRKFEKDDKINSYPENAALFVGSSSIRFWFGLKKDFPSIPIIKRGFGGAKINDLIYYFDRIIFKYNPKTIVMFVGTNDISGRKNDKTAEQVFEDFRKLATDIKIKLPETVLIYLPITPTAARWHVWPEVKKTNLLIANYMSSQENMVFIDTDQYFLDEQGLPREDLLWWDGTHLNSNGYKMWKELLAPWLICKTEE